MSTPSSERTETGLRVLLAAAALALTWCCFSATEIYYANPVDFVLTRDVVLSAGVSLAALCMLLLGWPGFVLGRAMSDRYAALLASGALLAWVEGAFLATDLGPLDGRPLVVAHGVWPYVDAALWVAVLAAPQAVSALRTAERLRAVCAVVLLAQAGTLTVAVLTRDDHAELKAHRADYRPMLEWSSTRNVIVVVLDEFQGDVFLDVLGRRPDLAVALDGFTVFTDTLATAKQTFPSLPEVLTGQRYRNQEDVSDYLLRAYAGDTLLSRLHAAGFRTEVYPAVSGMVHLSPAWVDNTVPARVDLHELARLLDAGLFRAAPRLLKPAIYRDGAWLTSSDSASGAPADPVMLRLWRGLSRSRVGDAAPRFKFVHLPAMHAPLLFDDTLAIVDGAAGRDAYTRQAVGVVRIVGDLLDRIREAGVYDDALIVLMSDHGSGTTPDLWIDPTHPEREAFNIDKARGSAMLAVKRPGERGPLLRSGAPVSLADLRVTILSEVGLPTDGVDGTSVYDVPLGVPRERHYMSYTWERFNAERLGPIQEYVVTGPVVDDASWRAVAAPASPAP